MKKDPGGCTKPPDDDDDDLSVRKLDQVSSLSSPNTKTVLQRSPPFTVSQYLAKKVKTSPSSTKGCTGGSLVAKNPEHR